MTASVYIPSDSRKERSDAIGNIDISQTFNFDSGNGDTKTATLTDDTAITLTATRPGMYWLLLRGDDGVTERLITWSTSVSGFPPASVTSSTYTVIQLFWDGATWHATA